MKKLYKRIWLLVVSISMIVCLAGCVEKSRNKIEKERIQEGMTVANAMFEEHCKKSGEFIYKTVEDVDGIFLMKIRRQLNYGDQFKLDDPYGRDLLNDAYIESFIRVSKNKYVNKLIAKSYHEGYRYVEAVDPADGERYRYTGAIQIVGRKDEAAPNIIKSLDKNPDRDLNNYDFVLEKELSTEPRPRYGVTYEDISTQEDREYWIAGSSLRVVDLATNEVIAERVGYMLDYGQGNKVSGRTPWLFAADNACPEFSQRNGASLQRRQTYRFVSKVLKPVQEEQND